MNMRCQGCGIEKDATKHEVYPFPEDGRFGTKPLPPLLEVDTDLSDGHGGSVWALVCHRCFSKLDPDMWINQEIWESIGPVTPYAELRILS